MLQCDVENAEIVQSFVELGVSVFSIYIVQDLIAQHFQIILNHAAQVVAAVH